MSLSVVCPSCRTKLKAPDNLLGRAVKCPKCGASITVGDVTPDLPVASVYIPLAVTMTAEVVQGPETKSCPFCGEEVMAVAKKCKHCGETIDIALRAAEEAKREAQEARRAAERPSQPMVFMNAGGGAASSSSSSAAAAAASRGRRRQTSAFPCIGCLILSGAVFLGLVSCGGIIVLLQPPSDSGTAQSPKQGDKPTPAQPKPSDGTPKPAHEPTAKDEADAVAAVLDARDLLVRGQKAKGRAKLEDVVKAYPGTKAAKEARAWLDELKK